MPLDETYTASPDGSRALRAACKPGCSIIPHGAWALRQDWKRSLYSHYLFAIVRALRDEVAPSLDGEDAKDTLGACLRTLAMLASSVERAESRLGPPPPPDILAQFGLPPQGTLPPVSRSGTLLPTTTVTDDAPGGGLWAATIQMVVDQLRSATPWHDAAARSATLALVEWEQQLRGAHLRRADQLLQAALGGPSERPPFDGPAFKGIEHAALEAYLRRRLGSEALQVNEFRLVVGGRSRQTVLFAIEGCDGVASQLVCQRDQPAGINPGGGVRTQFLLLHILHDAGIKVPRPVLFETDSGWLGAPFLICERVPGRAVINPATDYFAPPPALPQLALSLATQLGNLHAVATATVDGLLSRTIAVPHPHAWREEAQRIRERWRAQATGASITVEAALGWLVENADCVTDRLTIVHTDMLLHNVLTDGDSVTAVVDWEIAHLGHPAEDLGYLRPVVERMTDWDAFIAAYVAAGGVAIPERELDWFSLRAVLNLATLAQFSRGKVDEGASDDIRIVESAASWLPRLKERLAEIFLRVLSNDTLRGASS